MCRMSFKSKRKWSHTLIKTSLEYKEFLRVKDRFVYKILHHSLTLTRIKKAK